jgi:hypothetical protein
MFLLCKNRDSVIVTSGENRTGGVWGDCPIRFGNRE